MSPNYSSKYLYDAEGQVCAVTNLVVGTMTGHVYNAEGVRLAKERWTFLSRLALSHEFLMAVGGDVSWQSGVN
jgi:hypothetical protein